MRQSSLRPQFVDFIPEAIEEGVLYISMEYRTTAHRCCCGCGNMVYLPLSPTQWRLTFDGQSVWMDPSVGSWSLPCRSHYWIHGNRILWAEQWTNERVQAARAKGRGIPGARSASTSPAAESVTPTPAPTPPRRSRWRKFRALFGLK